MQPVVPFQYFTAEKSPPCQLSSLVRNNVSSLDPSYHSATFLHSPPDSSRPDGSTQPTRKSRHNDRSQTTLPSCVVIRLVNWAAAFPPPAAPGRQVPWSSPTEIAALIVLLWRGGVRFCKGAVWPVLVCSQVESQTARRAGVKGLCDHFLRRFIVLELAIEFAVCLYIKKQLEH